MNIGVRIKTGRAILYSEDLSPKELRGIRRATTAERERYKQLKPLFEQHKIREIKLAKPK